MTHQSTVDVARAAALIAAADSLLITAGAGIGVDSGLPDFRGNEGFWRAYPALGHLGIPFTSIAAPAAFRSRPRVAWGFYGHRLALYRRTAPHDGFAILRRWAAEKPGGCFVFTSNVDGQFQRAGFDSQSIHECHGSIHHLQCLVPCVDRIWEADEFEPKVDDAACELRNAPPVCLTCTHMARPNVLMFNDHGWLDSRSTAQENRLRAWLATARRPVVVEMGAGTAIPSVRLFGESVARRFGAGLVRINPRESAVGDSGCVGLTMGARDGLQALDRAFGRPTQSPAY